jgi:hypothetical protein
VQVSRSLSDALDPIDNRRAGDAADEGESESEEGGKSALLAMATKILPMYELKAAGDGAGSGGQQQQRQQHPPRRRDDGEEDEDEED